MIVSIVGIMKSGGAYVPIDIDYPENRVKSIIEDSRAMVLLTKEYVIKKKFSQDFNNETEVVCIDKIKDLLKSECECNLKTISGVNDLIYVIYTSGSTGKPKGVMIEHHNVVNMI
jgi:non-ribosomal peptide synthetase component F